MQSCKYSERVGCKKCSYAFYKQCANFNNAHYFELAKEIVPFVYKDCFVKETIAYSPNKDLIKSAAVRKAIESNIKIVKLSLNQVISLTVSGEDIPQAIYFVDCKAKVNGDADKLSSVLNSFIDKCQYSNICVYIYKPITTALDLSDYKRL